MDRFSPCPIEVFDDSFGIFWTGQEQLAEALRAAAEVILSIARSPGSTLVVERIFERNSREPQTLPEPLVFSSPAKLGEGLAGPVLEWTISKILVLVLEAAREFEIRCEGWVSKGHLLLILDESDWPLALPTLRRLTGRNPEVAST